MHFYCTGNNFGGCNDGFEKNNQSYAGQRKRPRDLLYFCKRLHLHVGKTPIDDAGYLPKTPCFIDMEE